MARPETRKVEITLPDTGETIELDMPHRDPSHGVFHPETGFPACVRFARAGKVYRIEYTPPAHFGCVRER
jgi:hypothetical protein